MKPELKPYRVTLHFDTGTSVVTEEKFPELEDEPVDDQIAEMMQDRETGFWKQLGHVNFAWKRLIAFEVEAL
jgi:hypothetical protein